MDGLDITVPQKVTADKMGVDKEKVDKIGVDERESKSNVKKKQSEYDK